MTGRPRSSGRSRCSTAAKNASTSACRIVASICTNICSHRVALRELREHHDEGDDDQDPECGEAPEDELHLPEENGQDDPGHELGGEPCAREPDTRHPEPSEQPTDRARLEPCQLGGTNTLLPANGHLLGLTARGAPVNRRRLTPALPVLERAASILERGRREHPLDEN